MPSIINQLKKQILLMAYQAKEGHVAGAFSSLDILWVLYDRVLKANYFILSRSSRFHRFFRPRFTAGRGYGPGTKD